MLASIQLGLDLVPVGEKLFTDRVECTVEDRQEFQCFWGEDLGGSLARGRVS